MSSSQTASSSHLSDSSLSDVDSNRSSSLSEDSDDEIEATKVAKQVKEEKKLKLIPLDYDLEEDEEVEHELLSIPEGRIESNWEVAFVCAFLIKFTHLRSFDNPASLFQSILDFEKALLNSSPNQDAVKAEQTEPATTNGTASNGTKVDKMDVEKVDSENGIEEDGDSTKAVADDTPAPPSKKKLGAPPGSDLLVEIIKVFQSNLKLVIPTSERVKDKPINKRDWFPWLESWVTMRFQDKEREKGAKRPTGLNWERNILARTVATHIEEKGNDGQNRFWKISWQEKVHLLRIIVDWQLAYSPQIVQIVTANYNYKTTKDKINRSNYLSIEEIGTINDHKIYHFDESPRIYSAFVPTEKQMALGKVSTWNCIAHDLTSYRAYMRSLPVMPSESESSEGGYFTMFKKEKKGKGKAKKVDRLGGDEMAAAEVRVELESRLSDIQQNEMKTRQLVIKRAAFKEQQIQREIKMKEAKEAQKAEKAAKKQERFAARDQETATEMESVNNSGGRKVKKPTNYATEITFSDDSEGDGEEDENASKKRKDKPEEDDEAEFKDDESDEEGAPRKSKRVKKEVIKRPEKVKVVKEWTGERRSSRLSRGGAITPAPKVDDRYTEKEEEEEEEEEVEKEDSEFGSGNEE